MVPAFRSAHATCRRCIIPPYMLEQLARNGNDRQRSCAIDTLSLDSAWRVARVHALLDEVLLGPAAAPPPGASASPFDAAAAPPEAAVSARQAVPQRVVHDARHAEQLDGPVVRREGEATRGDPAVDEAYVNLGATWSFYWDVLQRDSIDDRGLTLEAHVHYGVDYDNAFWDGARMVFGDGDGELFNRFTIALDVIAHELTHGVTEREAALVYQGQAGALNESVSDVFGSLVKQWSRGQTATQADWLIGDELLTDKVRGVALRSMQAPGTAYDDPTLGKDPQPSTMAGYVRTARDNGGVHINSGIPNHAFYRLATALGGFAWERAGRIWYDALRAPDLPAAATFRAFAAATVAAAERRNGVAGDEAEATRQAWAAVGVRP